MQQYSSQKNITLQDKNEQICASFAFVKDKNAFSLRELCPPDTPTKGSAPGPRWSFCLHPI